ncbi:MAG: hypothetical protein AAF517_22360, partial [Planctomycetota bacterium]
TTLFESILYTGTIGPVPVTIWASIGFGLNVLIQSQVSVFLTPFSLLSSGNALETHFYLLSEINLTVPCQVRADILGGIGSVSVELEPQVDFRMDTHVRALDANPATNLFVETLLSIVMKVEGCIDLLLAEACVGVDIPLVTNEPIIDTIGCDPRPVITCENPNGGDDEYINGNSCNNGSPFAGEARGGVALPLPSFYQVTSAPTMAVSPDQQWLITCSFDPDGLGHVALNDIDVEKSPEIGAYLDPSAIFVSNELAFLAWTASYCSEAPGRSNRYCPGGDAGGEPSIGVRNELSAMLETVVTPIIREPGKPWKLLPRIRISDVDEFGELLPLNERHADGRPSISAPQGPDAIAAEIPALAVWVHYETAEYLEEVPNHTTRIWEPRDNGRELTHDPVDLPTIRPDIDATNIYARHVALEGVVGPRVKISNDGINIEPSVSYSPTGNLAYVVWIHDPVNENLVEENTGRSIQFSIYDRQTDSWSPPEGVLEFPGDFPGLLQPSVQISDDEGGLASGLVAFTALDPGAPLRDTGLGGGSRSVWVSHIEDGVFTEPVRIHGVCQKREYGQWVTPIAWFDEPYLVDPMSFLNMKNPNEVIIWQRHGLPGVEDGAGGLMASVKTEGSEWSPPVCLSPPGRVVSNVAAVMRGGQLETMHVDAGESEVEIQGLARRGLQPRARTRSVERMTCALEPDLAITRCQLERNFPAPGSRVKATVDVQNLGIAGTPIDGNSRVSATGLKFVFVDPDGKERIARSVALPELEPRQQHSVEVEIEMPIDPVLLNVRLDPNPIDRDRTNNSRQCVFGTPAPRDVVARSIRGRQSVRGIDGVRDRVTRGAAVLLTWKNETSYDEVLVYRDGSLLTCLPGRC